MSPRTGRPKTENPRTERVSITLTKEDMETAQNVRKHDSKPERTFATWLARIVSETIQKVKKRQ